jgi:hypothetical protein
MRAVSLSRSRPCKRIRTFADGTGHDEDGGGGRAVELSVVLASLESVAADLKDFIQLLACCRAIPRQLAATGFRSDDKYMFGRLIEREQIIGFLTRDGPGVSLDILPIVGGPEVGRAPSSSTSATTPGCAITST